MAVFWRTDEGPSPWKKPGKQGKEVSRSEDEKMPTKTKITESAKPFLEGQTLLKEKLKSMPTWKKDKDAHLNRKTQPVVARPPSPGTSANTKARPQATQFGTLPVKVPSPPARRRTPGNSPSNSFYFSFPWSSSPVNDAPNELKHKVEKAMRARLYLLQQTGPKSFLIGGDSANHKFHVMIGPQSCTCTKPHCLHLLFVMLRVFKLKENDPLLWTRELKNFEVEELLNKFHARVKSRVQKDMNAQKTSQAKGQRSTSPTTTCTNSLGVVPQAHEDDEVCPICLLEMVEGESLTSCQDGCHNRLHQHCMEIWAAECKRQQAALFCPLCRKIWSSPSNICSAMRSPDHSIRSELPSVPAPLGSEEITPPHSNPVPAAQEEQANPWIEDIIKQEEAEAMAKAMAVSSLDSGPSRIPSSDPGDESVIIFTQPEEHQYLEGVHWKKGKLLGTGAYSFCYAVRDLTNGSLIAVKQISFYRNSKKEQIKVTQIIEDEISLLRRLQHPHLIKCFGATRQAGHFYIFLEWMAGGSITNLLTNYGPFDEKIVINYTRQILQGVEYLHQNQVIHRDIKGENILVDSTGKNIKIADFGAAARLATQKTGTGEFEGQLLGTVPFMAPEVLRGESYGRSCDVWSVACVILEMVTGEPPWNTQQYSNHWALLIKIAMAESPPDIPESLNPALRDVLLRCFESKQDERPPATELLRHPLFTQM